MLKARTSFVLFATLAIGACVVSGCAAGNDSAASTASDVTVQLDDPKAEADAVVVASDSVTFPSHVSKSSRVIDLMNRTVKNETVFLVGTRASNAVLADGTIDPNSKNPNGYMRKIVSAEMLPNGDTKFNTAPASLIEAQPAMKAAGFFSSSNSDDCFPQTTNAFNLYNIDLSRTLYQKSFGSIGSMNIALKNTKLAITGNLDTQVTGGCFSPDSAHAILTLNLAGGVTLEGKFDGAFGAETGSMQLYHKQIAITSVAGYPLSLDFTVSAECEFDSNGKAQADVGGTINGTIAAGGSWQSGQGFSSVFRPQWPQMQAIGPTFSTNATIEGKCTLSAKGQALIFDSTEGPYAQADTYLQLDGTGNGGAAPGAATGSVEAKLTAGVDIGLGGSIRSFDYTIVDNISAPSYSQDWQIFDKTFSVGGQ